MFTQKNNQKPIVNQQKQPNYSEKQNSFFGSIVVGLTTFCVLTVSLAGAMLLQNNVDQKTSFAGIVYACNDNETLANGQCISATVPTPTYTEGCPTDYMAMNAVCTKTESKNCSDYPKAMNAEAGLCKINVDDVLIYEIVDKDGRYCGGTGYNFKQYNVGKPRGATDGAIVCGNNFNATSGKENFRFIPKNVLDIKNFMTSQTGTTYSPCPTGYTATADKMKCIRPATSKGCDMAGEYFQNSVCTPCPAGQYCPNNSTTTSKLVCANGGTLTDNKCLAKNKISITNYTDGCGSGYIKYDQSCAIEEVRTHDLGCSYFYSSDTVNVTAVLSEDGKRCSTGGRTDFAFTSIYKVSDLQCDGPGTAYYNYNVSYDPLICGSTYTETTKANFRWLPTTFAKITGLQKIAGTITTQCPPSWIDAGGDTCYQTPINQEYKTPIDCPINTYCPAGSSQPTPCPAGYTSPAKSTMATDCKIIGCTNGAINPPSCNQCAGEQEIVNGNCVIKCNFQQKRDSTNGNCVNIPAVVTAPITPTPAPVVTPPIQVVTIAPPVTQNPTEVITINRPVVPTPVTIVKKDCVAQAGYYSAGENCIICPKNYYCPAGSTNPTMCPLAMTTDSTGAKALEECKQIVTIVKTETKTIRTGGLTALMLVLAPSSLFALAYFYYFSKNNKSNLNKQWTKIK